MAHGLVLSPGTMPTIGTSKGVNHERVISKAILDSHLFSSDYLGYLSNLALVYNPEVPVLGLASKSIVQYSNK